MSADLATRPDIGVRITDVVVGVRGRKDYGDLTSLVESIQQVGLLQPIGLAPGNRLLFGGRRLEACRRLGWESIPVTRPETQDDALSLLKAERDENICRKDMTPEEKVDLGLRIEELEQPAADARQREGQERGRKARWAGSPSGEGKPVKRSHAGETNSAVGEALGMSGSSYFRAKHVIQTARGENHPEPEAQAAAQEALRQMNAGEKTINGAYEQVKSARKRKEKAPKPVGKRPEILRRTHRIHSRRVIAATVETYLNNAIPPDLLAEVRFSELETHDLREWISSLSESAKALRSLRTTLEKELSQRG